ncbi:hypothetical protein KI387_001991, partial [Taxus chinensis]
PWAKVELRRHDVSEVSDAIVVADRLLDFREETSSKSTQNPNTSKGKSVDKGQSKSSVKPQGGNKGGKNTQESSEGSQKSSNNSKNGGKKSQGGESGGKTFTPKCWTCGKAHYNRDCPERQRVSA